MNPSSSHHCGRPLLFTAGDARSTFRQRAARSAKMAARRLASPLAASQGLGMSLFGSVYKYAPLGVLVLLAVATAATAADSVAAEAPKHMTAAEFGSVCDKFPALSACLNAKMEKRKSAYMRFGRAANPPPAQPPAAAAADGDAYESMVKRKSAYMRFGKRFPSDEMDAGYALPEKRKSAYMRFGKRKSAYMRFGKREAEAEFEQAPMEKRKSAYMRFGKRTPLLAAPDAAAYDDDAAAGAQMEKRKSAYMRFGRK